MPVPLLNYTDRDVFVLTLTLFGEARGMPVEGQMKVAWVIRNRAERSAQVGLGGAVTAVCRRPWQFSCWNLRDPNSERLQEWLDGHDLGKEQPLELGRLSVIARIVLQGSVPDMTYGADHYHTIVRPDWANEWPPFWAASMRETARDPDWDGHVFYDSRGA